MATIGKYVLRSVGVWKYRVRMIAVLLQFDASKPSITYDKSLFNASEFEDESDAEDSDSDDDNESCYSAASIDDLSENALNVLKTIGECKKLVEYVKKVVRFLLPTFYFLYFLQSGLNQKIKDAGGHALKQSTSVRWLSLIELLESVEKSAHVVGKVLVGKKRFHIDMDIVHSLIRLLRPFKFVIQIIQQSTEP